MITNLLEIKNLTVKYDGQENVVKNVNINIGNKEIIGIVGESGCGKTTLIRTIINLLPKNGCVVSGELIYNGKNLLQNNNEQWRRLRGNDIAMIFQNPASYLNAIMKISKQFTESIITHRSVTLETAREKARSALKKMNLSDTDRIMNSYPFQLSGGMKQRVAIAMAIAMEPKLIIADEPTSDLDAITQKQISNELMELRDKLDTSIIIVTHNLGCAAYMADKIMVMNQGKIEEYSDKNNVINFPRKVYTRRLLEAIPKLKGLEA